MTNYMGTKAVSARPMTLGEYNTYRGWSIPADENPLTEGFLVEYQDGGEPNHPLHEGYISWWPAAVFTRYYQPASQMSFSHALTALNGGRRLSRAGWDSKDIFIFKVNGSEFKVNREPLLSILGEGTDVSYCPHIDMKNADGSICVWNASQADLFANDWYIV